MVVSGGIVWFSFLLFLCQIYLVIFPILYLRLFILTLLGGNMDTYRWAEGVFLSRRRSLKRVVFFLVQFCTARSRVKRRVLLDRVSGWGSGLESE